MKWYQVSLFNFKGTGVTNDQLKDESWYGFQHAGLHIIILHHPMMRQVSLYCQTFNISHTLIGNKIVDHKGVVGAWAVGAAPTTSSFLT